MDLYSLAVPLISAVKPLDRFTVIRRRETVDSYGRSQTTTIRYWAVGSIAPSGDNTLSRAEEYQTQGNTITVITRFLLRGPSKDAGSRNYQPDIIEFDDSHYIVVTLSDYARYGAGLVSAECVSIDFIDQAPTTL